jgi:hypothetical protein
MSRLPKLPYLGDPSERFYPYRCPTPGLEPDVSVRRFDIVFPLSWTDST